MSAIDNLRIELELVNLAADLADRPYVWHARSGAPVAGFVLSIAGGSELEILALDPAEFFALAEQATQAGRLLERARDERKRQHDRT